jgi:hypothetical protein
MLDFFLSVRFGTHDLIPDLQALKLLAAEAAAKTDQDLARPTLGHLWFLYYLCMFYVLIPLYRWLARRTETDTNTIARWLSSPLSFVALALWTAATLWPFKGGQVHEASFISRHICPRWPTTARSSCSAIWFTPSARFCR